MHSQFLLYWGKNVVICLAKNRDCHIRIIFPLYDIQLNEYKLNDDDDDNDTVKRNKMFFVECELLLLRLLLLLCLDINTIPNA